MDNNNEKFSSSDPKIKNKKSEILNIIINLVIIIAALVLALSLFGVYKNYEDQKEKESLVPRAKKAYEIGSYSESTSLFVRAEQVYPDNLEIKKYLANLYFIKGKYDKTIEYYSKIGISNLNQTEISALGNSYLKNNQFDKVLETWENVELSEKDKYSKAKIYLLNKDYDKYFEILEQINTIQEAVIYRQIKQTDLQTIISNAENAKNLESVDSQKIDIDNFIQQLQESKKQFDFNKKDYSELIQIAAFTNIDQCYYLNTRIQNLKSSLSNQRLPIYQAEFLEGKCANQSNEPNKAIPLINKAIEAEKTNIDYREELAESYLQLKNIDEITKIYNEIFLINKNSKLYQNLASHYYNLEDNTKSVETYFEAMKLSEDIEELSDISNNILQIEFFENKNIEICKNDSIIQNIGTKTRLKALSKNICLIYRDNSFENSDTLKDIDLRFLKALNSKSSSDIKSILDSDTDQEALITNLYFSVGENIVKIEN